MRRWLRRNARLGLWIHALFLLLIVFGWAPAPVDTISTFLLLTVFLPHFLVAQKLGGFTSDVWSLSAIIMLSAVSAVATFPLSLLYASIARRVSARVQRYRHARSEQPA